MTSFLPLRREEEREDRCLKSRGAIKGGKFTSVVRPPPPFSFFGGQNLAFDYLVLWGNLIQVLIEKSLPRGHRTHVSLSENGVKKLPNTII
jgi:hypothetical protein